MTALLETANVFTSTYKNHSIQRKTSIDIPYPCVVYTSRRWIIGISCIFNLREVFVYTGARKPERSTYQPSYNYINKLHHCNTISALKQSIALHCATTTAAMLLSSPLSKSRWSYHSSHVHLKPSKCTFTCSPAVHASLLLLAP